MKPVRAAGWLVTMFFVGCAVPISGPELPGDDRAATRQGKLVIAHRGASGYLPEHTPAAKAMAYAQGAHFIEQDLVMTRDDQLVVLHDLQLDAVTNVRDVYPDRARDDGRYYVIDFTLAELRALAVTERSRESGGSTTAVFSRRFPLEKSSFRISTFAEEIELIQGLNRSTGRSVGIYPEIKDPAFHRAAGKDISAAALRVLKAYGYRERQDNVFLQCFDPGELQRIRGELLPAMNMNLRLVQLLGTQPEFRVALTPAGMDMIASYADGVGPAMQLIVAPGSVAGGLQVTELVRLAHDNDLVVHPFTFRRDRLPEYAGDYEDLLKIYLEDIGVDGVFTDFPDLTARYIGSNL